MSDDIRCNWCNSVVAIQTDSTVWMVVRENAQRDGKFFCHGSGGDCYDNLVKRSQYVLEHFVK